MQLQNLQIFGKFRLILIKDTQNEHFSKTVHNIKSIYNQMKSEVNELITLKCNT